MNNFNVAIVEDEKEFSDQLQEYLRRYAAQHGMKIGTDVFKDAESMLIHYNEQYALVFLDVNLPMMSGLKCAAELRKADKNVVLIFITNFAQYAVKGYDVDALAYMVKPMVFSEFCLKMDRAVQKAAEQMKKESIVLSYKGMTKRIFLDKLMYIEVLGHFCSFHMVDEVVEVRIPLHVVQSLIMPYPQFVRCSKYHLVNLLFVSQIKSDIIFIGINKEEIKISRTMKAQIVQAFAEVIAQRKV